MQNMTKASFKTYLVYDYMSQSYSSIMF